MLDFALKVAVAPFAIGEQEFEGLKSHGFSQDDVWDIAAIAAFFAMSNRLANVSDMRPNDEFYSLGRG
jgi:4-carboxymuconolactone decarboxylase